MNEMGKTLIAIVIAGVLLVSSVVGASCARADDFANQIAALEVIKKAAGDICYTVSQDGSRSNIQLSGEVRAQLNIAILKMVDLGIKGAGQYNDEQYKGVLQEELAATLKSSIDCKLEVFNKLVNKMLGWRPPASQSTITQIGGFILEGEQISDTFLKTNNTGLLITQYAQWASNIEKYLAQILDAAYAAQFKSAQSTAYARNGMNIGGAGIWQKLQGQNAVLSQIVTELRRS
jgi:hypothetical protein